MRHLLCPLRRCVQQLLALAALCLGSGLLTSADAAPALLGTRTFAATTAAATSLTIGRPTTNGTRVLLLAQISVRGGSGVTITPPAGWALVNRTDSGTVVALAVYSKWAANTATEPTTYAFTFTSGHAVGSIAAFSGSAPGTPIPVNAGAFDTTSARTLDAPAISPAMGDTLLVAVFGSSSASLSYTAPPGMTERTDRPSSGTGSGTRLSMNTQVLAASGNTGIRTTTASGNVTGSAILLALAPAQLPPFYLQATGVPGSTLDKTVPTAPTLANHDSPRDAAAGIVIAKGGSGAAESVSTLYQRWLSDGQGIVLNGTFQLRLWSAMKDFNTSLGGSVTAYLRDCDGSGSGCSTLATSTLTLPNWSGGVSGWTLKTFSFGALNLEVAAGRTLELKLIVGSGSGDSMWFAYAAAAQASVVGAPVSAVDNYQVTIPSTGLSCLPSTVTVTACADSSSPCSNPVTTINGQTAALTTSAGTLGSASVTFNSSGVASTTLSFPLASDGEVVSVTLGATTTAANSASRCCPDGSSCTVDPSCDTTFNTAGFVIAAASGGAETTVPTQTAGTASGSFVLRAVRTNTTTMACQAALTGANPVDWAYECNDPGTCSGANRMVINGGTPTTVQRNNDTNVSSYTSVPMTFDANGNAPFTFTFSDVGLSTLWMRKTVTGAPLDGNSNAFVTRPAGFTVTGIVQTASPNTANPGATVPTGGRFVKAGESFTAVITATTSTGAAAPNFGNESSPEGVSLTRALVLPAGGTSGTLSNGTIPGSSFTNGVATVTNLAFSEVGVITLAPAVADGNYLGAGNVTGTTTGNIGRFVPSRFVLSAPTLLHRSARSCAPASTFSYLDETFRLTMTLTAVNEAGATTTNYNGTWARFDANTASSWSLAGIAGSTVFSGASGRLSLGSAAGSWSAGVLSAATLNAAALRAAAPDGPFSAVFGVAPVDPDGVALTGYDLDTDFPANGNDRTTAATVALRFGRLRLQNALGAADRALSLPLQAESWSGGSFALNTLDSCTSVPTTAVNLGNRRGSLTVADGTALGAATLASGSTTLRIGAPGGGRSGTLDVALSLGTTAADASCLGSWTPSPAATAGAGLAALRGNWCSASYGNDPAARATFGRQRSSGSTVFRREVH